MEANTLRGLDAKWEAAHEALAAAVHALDPERVHAAATEWVDCAIRFGNAVPMDGTTNSGDEGPSDTNMGRIWGRMEALSQLGARLGEATQQPGREECATECVARFCRAVWPRILDEQAYPSWEDNGEYGDVFCNVPLVGSAKATLRLVLTRYGSYQSWCYRHSDIWTQLQGRTRVEYVPAEGSRTNTPIIHDTLLRMLERCLLAVRGVLEAMRDARQAARDVRPRLTDKQINHLTYLTGQRCVARAKTAHYRSLFRKWWWLWTITSGWLKLVGERQGGVGGPVGAAAVAAYDVEMGDGAVKPNSV